MNTKTVSTARSFSRRSFLRSSTILAAGAGLPLTALAQGRRVENVGLQLYTLRNEMSQTSRAPWLELPRSAIRKWNLPVILADLPAQVRQTLDQNGMSSPAAHIQLQALQRRPRGRG